MVPPTSKRMVRRVTEAPWRMEQRPLCCSCAALSWLCGRMSSVLDFDEVNAALKNAEMFGSVLPGEGGSANGWRCCWGAPGLLQLPLATPENPPPFIASLLLFYNFAEIRATSTASGRLEVNLFLSEKRGGKSHFGTILVSAVLRIWRFCIANRLLLTYIHADIAGF